MIEPATCCTHDLDVGTYSRLATTSSQAAKTWFDRGLVWCYGFNMEEAQRCFARAVEHDPHFALAHWGSAYARGPFYNKPWRYFSEADAASAVAHCHHALVTAKRASEQASPFDRALIEATLARYPTPEYVGLDHRLACDANFEAAMRRLHREYPDDLDVAALFAFALMSRTPWKLWDLRTGAPAEGSATLEAQRVLEAGLAAAERQRVTPHPGLAHAYIHCMEMSPWPERALAAADSLRDYSRDCGHLHHMPCHVYAQCGLFHDAIIASEKAVAADARYRPPPATAEFYVLDRCHHLHMLMFTACMMGRYQTATRAAAAISEVLTRPVLLAIENPFLARAMEGFLMHGLHVQVRFGRWRELVETALPDDPVLYPASTAMTHYARGIAHAALGHHDAADAEREAFHAAVARVPADRFVHQNPVADILAVGASMLEGEVAYHRGRHTAAFEHLREAVRRDDQLAYCEPWAWMHPPRHALGALLLEQGHVEEAAAAYRADLGLDGSLIRAKQNPNNIWSLTGYHECLERLARHDEARVVARLLAVAQARVDTPIQASCCCRTSVFAP